MITRPEVLQTITRDPSEYLRMTTGGFGIVKVSYLFPSRGGVVMKMRLFGASLLLLVPISALVWAQQQDFSKVEMKTTAVAGNVSLLQGEGGNIGVSAGPDGLLIIDDEFAPLAPKIEAAIKALNPGKL